MVGVERRGGGGCGEEGGSVLHLMGECFLFWPINVCMYVY